MTLNLKNKNTLTLLLAIFLIHNFAYSQDDIIWKSIDNKSYKIAYPSDWELDTSGQMNTEFLLFSKITKNDTFRENVNLMIQDLSNQNLNLESYTELSLKQIKSFKDAKLIEKKEIIFNTKKAYQVIWSGFVSGSDLKFKQIYFIKNDKAYLLTLSCHQTAYQNYEAIGTKILNTFILK